MALNTKLYGKNGETQTQLNPETVAAQVIINDAAGVGSNVEAEIEKLRTDVAALINGGVVFKGALTTTSGLPTVSYKAGWQYIVQDAGTYAGKVCEAGDFVVCVKNYASGSASNSDWAVLQVNIVGAVTGPANSVANHVAAFDGTSGKITFSSSIGKNEHIAAIVTNGQDPVQVAVSQSRPTAIASGGAYDVPEHTVGGNKLQVFIDGLLITPTIDYQEISQTQIVFNDSVPADRQIVIYRR